MGTAPGPQGMGPSSMGGQQGPLSPPAGLPGSLPQGMMPLPGGPMPFMGYYPAPYFPPHSAGFPLMIHPVLLLLDWHNHNKNSQQCLASVFPGVSQAQHALLMLGCKCAVPKLTQHACLACCSAVKINPVGHQNSAAQAAANISSLCGHLETIVAAD